MLSKFHTACEYEIKQWSLGAGLSASGTEALMSATASRVLPGKEIYIPHVHVIQKEIKP